MGQQLLFCIEADSKSKTDWVYIKATINILIVLDDYLERI